MNDHDMFSPAERDQLEQELLELHFGCHEDPARLEARLAAEPALRALQREVLRQAKLLEDAVRPEQPQLELPTADARAPRRRWFTLARGRLSTAAALAACTVLGFLVVERLANNRNVRHLAERLHVTVSAPKAVPAGAPWSFTVQAKDLRGDPASCRVRWQAFAANDAVLGAGEAPLRDGNATVVLKADLQVPQRVEVVASHTTDEVRQVLTLSTAAAGPLVHVTTDRPVYRPGETVYARTVVLDRVTLLPLPHTPRLMARLLDGKGAPVQFGHDMAPQSGVGSFAFVIPDGSAGGVHRVEVMAPMGEFPPESAEVVVRSFEAPQLKKLIVLDRTTYAPGARGSAAVTAERLGAGGGASGALAKAVLVIDGTEVWTDQKVLGANGDANFRFDVPADVKQGAARFVATITDGGIVETEMKPFVVPTGRVLVAGFPEGGELVAGVENSLYLECTDPLGRPVEAIGELLDQRDQRIERFRTEHQGRVRLSFTPREGESYHVRLAGSDETFALAEVKPAGIALRMIDADWPAGTPLRLAVAGRGDGPWLLGVFCRGVLVGQTTLRADDSGELRTVAEVALPAHAAGVLRATVFDRTLQPVAERLVRRAATHRIDVEVLSAHASLTPGETQQVTVRTKDESGRALAAVVGLSVTDLAVASLGSEPRIGLADHAQLFADVERTEQLGDFLPGHAGSAKNVDLLLGTRGWRRFVWRNDDAAKAAIAARGQAGEGVLAREGFSHTPQVLSNLQAAEAAGANLAADANRAARHLRDAAGVAGLVLVLCALGEALAWLFRRAMKAPPVLQVFVGVAAAGGLLLLVAIWWPDTLGARMTPVAEAVDFEGPGKVDHWIMDLGRVIPQDEAWRMEERWGALVGADDFYLGGNARKAGQVVAFIEAPADLIMPQAAPQGFVAADDARAEFERVAFARVGAIGQTPVRQYAHRHTPHEGRSDFAPMICWTPLVQTDARGEATVSFATSDSVTTWLVQADVHAATGAAGRVGQSTATFTTQLPFHLDAKLPDELSAGDELLLPIAATVTGRDLAEVAMQATAGKGIRLGDVPTNITLVDGRGRALVPITVDAPAAASELVLLGTVGRFSDRVQRQLRIVPRGFPHQRSAGGTVTAGAPATLTLAVPSDAVAGSGHITLKLYPSPLTALTEGLQGILQEPHGCFEQASSSNYPNTLVLTLLEASGDDVPAVAARARELLPKGYAKITGYECKQRGYEWFGGDPGHEALTAYGLLQFHDMAKVHTVDADMIARTRQWLLARRDGRGGYQRNQKALDRFGGAPPEITDAYVTYALLQAGTPAADLKREIDALVERIATKDAYELALIACALHAAGRPEAATARTQLAEMQQTDGSLAGASSITRSGARDLLVETTGFALLAWLPDPARQAEVRRAVEFLQASRGASGTFGATQATIVALRALTAYAQESRRMREPGTLRVFEGDTLLGERSFAANDVDALVLQLWNRLTPGEHTLRLEIEGGGEALPWACDVSYHAEQPADDPDTKVSIRASLRAASVVEGGTIALDVEVGNRTDEGQPMTMAVIGLPAGLEIPTRVLEDLKKANAFAFWELRGRELAIYWRDLAPKAAQKLTLDLVARVPGRSTGPASRAYLYYTPQQKNWATPLRVDVLPAR